MNSIKAFFKRIFEVLLCDHEFVCINLSDEQIIESGKMMMECQKCGRIKFVPYEDFK